ncbi:MAG: hypothetical protein K6B41_02415 [Butyrivibrio sp.]|nr:hypothetical protein [Butyrivibrio sp.]
MNLKKFGATLLTVSMAATFAAAPAVSVNAANYNTVSTTSNSNAQGATISANIDYVAKFIDDDDHDGQADMRAEAIAKGYVTKVTYYDDFDFYIKDETTDTTTYSYYTWNDGYSSTTIDYNGADYYVITKTTYTNTITNQSSTTRSDISGSKDNVTTIADTVYVKSGEDSYLSIGLKNGDTSIKNVKSSKKKIMTAKLFNKLGSTTITNDRVYTSLDEAKTTQYYYTSLGEKKIAATRTSTSEAWTYTADYISSNGSSAIAYIKVSPKKAGKSVISFDIYNNSGVKTGSKKIKVIAQADTDVFKTFTYAGKSLIEKTYGDTKYINYGKSTSDSTFNVVSKKKGKLVVKTNKNYKIVKIEVGKLSKAANSGAINYDGTAYSNPDAYYTYAYSGTTTTGKKVDLNGDGDYLDTINGIDEQDVDFTYSTVKSGKQLKLSTVGYNNGNETTVTAYKGYDYVAKASTAITSTSTDSDKSLYAPTAIKVTYYDKVTKTYTTTDPIILWTKAK